MPGPIVFSDLDGTLLDHETYGFDAARPALGRLVRLDIPVILASSKTAAEMRPLQVAMGLPGWPMICENGAGIVGEQMPPTYDRLRAALAALPADLRVPFEGFGDMTPARISAVTGLDAQAAALARDRAFSEPGLWHGGDATAFIAALAVRGIGARRGGRFLTLGFGGTKADRMTQIMRSLDRDRSIALGDAPNDIEMLDSADIGVIIGNPNAPPVDTSAPHIIRSVGIGPEGWNNEVNRLLDQAGYPG